MVRSDAGRRYDDFRDRGAAGIGFPEIAAIAHPGVDKNRLLDAYLQAVPNTSERSANAAASQVHRFVNEIQVGDYVVTYSPANRKYLVGEITGPCEHRPEWDPEGMNLSRPVKWMPREVDRDSLRTVSKNSLGSTLTIFKLSDGVRDELLALARSGESPQPEPETEDEDVVDPLSDYEAIAFERIKDLISRLDWKEFQDLVAGVLRAMGYKTQVSPPGSDLGRDILASPDGFGFEQPRIVVEVKHRKESINSQGIRGFIGGRHKDDRCLYVSTGGFTRDARYEADRSTIPVVLWTVEELTKALIDNYDNTDGKTKALVSLRTFYAPAADV
ncbi:restriction endonuclease [Mycolicibacterium thermoresistibile]